MNTEILLITAIVALTKMGIFGVFAWAFYRVLRRRPVALRVDSQSRYAHERAYGIRRRSSPDR